MVLDRRLAGTYLRFVCALCGKLESMNHRPFLTIRSYLSEPVRTNSSMEHRLFLPVRARSSTAVGHKPRLRVVLDISSGRPDKSRRRIEFLRTTADSLQV
jgi:hypothetical protein